jgi:hypothetical protein
VCVWGVRGDKGEREIKGLCTSSTCPAGIIPADQLIKYSRTQHMDLKVHTIYTPKGPIRQTLLGTGH